MALSLWVPGSQGETADTSPDTEPGNERSKGGEIGGDQGGSIFTA